MHQMSVYHLCYCLHLYYCCYAKTSSPAVQKRHSKVYGNPIAPSLYSILLTNNHVLPPKGGHQRLKAIVSIFNYVLHGKGKFQNSYVSLLIFLCSIYLTLLKFTATWLFSSIWKSVHFYNSVYIFVQGVHIKSGQDMCDCLILECPGCHFPCPK